MPGQSAGYTVGWGTLALINAGLAQGKGRSGLLWFLLSLLLGPFVTLLIVVLPAETGEARPLGRAEWFAIGVAVAVLLAVVFLLLGAAGISHG